MESLVLDASVTVTWCFPDEHSDFAYKVLDALTYGRAVVPSIWAVELANALVVGERRRRLTTSNILRFLELLDGLPIEIDTQTASKALRDTLQLARTHGLSVSDAAYLELAMREGLLMATLDGRLKNAAKAAGVKLFS